MLYREEGLTVRKRKARRRAVGTRTPRCWKVGLPATIRVDQGTEFVSRDLDLWAYQRGVTLDFSRPGKPTDNAFIEAFNGRFRAECLNAYWFLSLADAQEKLEDWRKYYNEERPMGRSARRRRLCCSITLAQPARHREEAGKLYPPAIQGSNRRWMKVQGQVKVSQIL